MCRTVQTVYNGSLTVHNHGAITSGNMTRGNSVWSTGVVVVMVVAVRLVVVVGCTTGVTATLR